VTAFCEEADIGSQAIIDFNVSMWLVRYVDTSLEEDKLLVC